MATLASVIAPAHRRFIRQEWAIGTVMSGLVPAVVIALFKGPAPVPLLGENSLLTALIGSTLLPASGMPVVLTLVIRMRVRNGGAPALGWPVAGAPLVNRMPRSLLLRGLLGALAAALILPAPGLVALALLGVTTLSKTGFVLYNFVHGAAIGALLAPFVVTAALADGARLSARRDRGT